jgi:epoxyqueuosine reductase QueG
LHSKNIVVFKKKRHIPKMTDISWIKDKITQLVLDAPENRLLDFGRQPIFEHPMVGIVNGDHLLFEEFRKVVSPQHLQPRKFLCRHSPRDADLTQVSVIVWILPFAEEVRRSNRRPNRPSQLYSIARNNGGTLIYNMSARLSEELHKRGFAAESPILTAEYDTFRMPQFTFSSTWSERHVAYAAGLGSFGLNEALITPLGINVRIGSIITNIPLESLLLEEENYRALCLQDGGESCGLCMERCPVGAITSAGLDKSKCYAFRKAIRDEYLEHYRQEFQMLPSPIPISGQRRNRYALGCALCQCGVPCESLNPFISPDSVAKNARY